MPCIKHIFCRESNNVWQLVTEGAVSNVFTISNYDGIDPEINNGFDNNLYPRPISFIIGLNLNF